MLQNIFTNLRERVNLRFFSLVAALAVVGGIGLVSATPSSTGLVAHWSFDQTSGTSVIDDSGNGYDAAISGSPDWVAGQVDNALSFTGGDAAAVGNVPEINGASQVTLTTWMKRAASGAAVLVGKQTTNNDVAIEAWFDGRVYFQLSNGSDTYGVIDLDDTDWHHFALVFDGTQTGNANRLKAYVDGVQQTLSFSGTVGATTTTDTTPFNFGVISGVNSDGQIDDTWLYSRALSQAEVQDLMEPETDILAPSVPVNLSANAVSFTQVDLSWDASTDDTGVAGYRVYRDGVEVDTTTGTTYQDSDLNPGTEYTYTVRAYDAAGNQSALSTEASATTQADTTAPSVDVTSPVDEATVDGTITLAATASDNLGVDRVVFSVDGVQHGADDTSAPYEAALNTTTLSNGTHTIRATAYDAANNSAYSEVTVTVDNETTPPPDTTAPSVSISEPADEATVDGSINVAATASDNTAVDRVVFAVDGTQIGSDDTTAPYEVSLDTATLTNGTHTIRATAYDQADNSAYDEVTVSVDNQVPAADATSPTVTLSSPAGNSTVTETVTITAEATDNVDVATVKFYVDGTQIGSDTTTPYEALWDTTALANGTVHLSVEAQDAAGNTATAGVDVTIDNTEPEPVTGSFVTGVSANGRHFTDQNNDPVLVKGDSPWALFSQLSPAEVELWAANREEHGFNSAIISLVGGTQNGGPSNIGATNDGIQPFVNGDITDWNEPYWERMDAYMETLRDHGITAFLYPMDGWNTLSGEIFYHESSADVYAYGAMVAERFESYPNIVWMVGGDYQYYDDPIVNTQFQSLLSGIRSTGDSRLFSIQHTLSSLSTDVEDYESLADWNFAYSYSTTYTTVLRGYNRAPSSDDPRPSLFSEGNYEGEDNTGGPTTTDETLRRQQLWALTSGSPGEFTGSQDWLFVEGWESRLDTTWITQMHKIRNFFEGLDWHALVPDDGDAVVTAGRGTEVTSETSIDVLENDYVTAAQTADGSQTVVYVPTNTGNTNARTITLDLSKLPSSYTATWVDPTDATSTQAASIDGAGQVTTPGLHSDGTRDWLLVIQ